MNHHVASAGQTAPLPAVLRHVLAGAIDYAGLFPPASLSMQEAVANYATYHAGPDSWALGRLVLPLARLDAFSGTAAPHLERVTGGAPWRLSALVEPGTPTQLKALHDFHAGGDERAVVDCIEGKAAAVEAVIPYARFREVGLEVFVEVPLTEDPLPLLRAIAEAGLSAKIRTGGITPDAIPDARDVARFLLACRDAGVPFKATAGLHHPIRADYRLTYAGDSPTAVMFGYLNVMLAAALAWHGAAQRTVVRLLEERDPKTLRLTSAGARWRDHEFDIAEIDSVREFFARGFGSCSFREPLDDLVPLLQS